MCVCLCQKMTESYPWTLRPDTEYFLIPFTSCQGNKDNTHKIWTNESFTWWLFTLSGCQIYTHKLTHIHRHLFVITNLWISTCTFCTHLVGVLCTDRRWISICQTTGWLSHDSVCFKCSVAWILIIEYWVRPCTVYRFVQIVWIFS